MLQNKTRGALLFIFSALLVALFMSCSNQKNTALTRFYHSVNTRYNIHFNAEEAYKETLRNQNESREDNLSQMLHIFPDNSDSLSMEAGGGNYTTTIDKATKAIKLHSIKVKPKRDPNRRNDPKYQAWLQQKEYTPFMDQVWLLLGRAEFHEGNYLRAITTFMYITKIYSTNPEIVAECQLWIARAYTEMGWMYEAGNVLHKMELAGNIPQSQMGFYSAVKANYLIRNNDVPASIPHLEYAINKEKDKWQKLRMKYLLGQLYSQTGEKDKAYKAFAAVQGMSTPYNYTFNAKLQQIYLSADNNPRDAISSLTKMSNSSKNKEYLDQLFSSIGNIYLQQSDTVKAVENYQKAIKESTRNGYDKTIAEVTLADIYFNKRNFVPAQPLYSNALSGLRKSHPAYPRVSLRSEVLDELVIHVKTVHEQDSLQYIAGLPEEQRLEIINAKIEQLKKEEEEKRKEEERLQKLEERENRVVNDWSDLENSNWGAPAASTPPSTPVSNTAQGDGSTFYFYNAQAVSQGKVAFQKRWGNRKLEDDWRRRNKLSVSSDSDNFDSLIADSLMTVEGDTLPEAGETDGSAISQDIYSVEYYLQQLPLTEEAVQESNVLIENALFNMGKIYKNKLEDFGLAVETFNTDISRFPQTPNLEEIYYQLFLIYMQTGDQTMMASYRNRLISEFPNGKYATPLSDPSYEWNFRYLPILQDSLYTAAYDAYKQADVQTVRDNYQTINNKYPFTDLMPKFSFLNALSYAQTRDIKGLESNLKELTQKYPKADVTPLATEILERIKEGKIILSDGSPITEFDWSKAYLGDNALIDSTGQAIAFSDSLNTEYLLLFMFKSNTIDRNDLLYQVADYNFSNYVIQTYDLSFDSDPPYDILQIKGFPAFSNIKSYINKALTSEGLIQKIDTTIIPVPISVENYTKTLPRLGMEQYMNFFAEHYNEELPALIAYWNKTESEIKVEEIEETDGEPAEETDIAAKDIQEKAETKVEEPQEVPVEEKKQEEKKKEEPVNDKQITADDLLTKDQLDKVGKVNEAVEDILSNPVDGIKNLFNKRKNEDNLTKEEKAALKAEEKALKERQKELKAIEKMKQDSINKIEKMKADSIKKVEKAKEDSIKADKKQKEQQLKLEEQRKKEAEKAAIKAKQDAQKQKENEREEKERSQKERLQQREKERKVKEKAQEKERKEKERIQKERLREREKEREEREKTLEKEKKEKERQANEKRKQQAKDR